MGCGRGKLLTDVACLPEEPSLDRLQKRSDSSSSFFGGRSGCRTSSASLQPTVVDFLRYDSENRDFAEKLRLLSEVALIKRIPKDQHPLLADACVSRSHCRGEELVQEGGVSSELIVLVRGEASVLVHRGAASPTTLASLQAGDYFGEEALLRDEPCSASLRADTDLDIFAISRETFRELGLNDKVEYGCRKAVGAGRSTSRVFGASTTKSEDDRVFIESALHGNQGLQTMVVLDAARVREMVDTAWKMTVEAGRKVIDAGDFMSNSFFIVHEGAFVKEVAEGTGGGPISSDAEFCGEAFRAGSSFGELALLHTVTPAATVKAVTDSVLWVIDRANFKDILMKVSEDQVSEYVRCLGEVKLLDVLLLEEKRALAKALVEMRFAKGESIMQQGEPGQSLFLLCDGEVTLLADGKELETMVAGSGTGGGGVDAGTVARPLGEAALLGGEPWPFTAVVASATAQGLALDRDVFNLLLGPLSKIIESCGGGGCGGTGASAGRPSFVRGCPSPVPAVHTPVRPRIAKGDLRRVGPLGCGGFGIVELWEHKDTKEVYALKGLSKGLILRTGMQKCVVNEKAILLMTSSKFIIKLFETFSGKQTLYFLLEPALGGDVHTTFLRKSLHGSHTHARYYGASVVFAFEHCHQRRIIYRDLKPENLLLTEVGRMKLTDMGLAKFVIGRTFTTCGTPDYFAPEMVASVGHSDALDWWTLGVLLFELLSGRPPFESAEPMEIYRRVMQGIGRVSVPPKCQGDAEFVIKGLLKVVPSDRLPMRPGGTSLIKTSRWYAGFDWGAMEAGMLEPPYKPVVKSTHDIANFSVSAADLPRHIEYKDDGSGWDLDFPT